MSSVSSLANINYQTTYGSAASKVSGESAGASGSDKFDFSESDKEMLNTGLNALSSGLAYNKSIINNLNTVLGSVATKGKATNSAASLWNSWGSIAGAVDAGYGTVLSVYSNRNELSSLLDKYSSVSDEFYGDFDREMSGVSSASNSLKSLNAGNFDPEANSEKDLEDNIASAVKTVGGFLDSYNSATTYLNSNSEVSTRVSSLAKSFRDNTYNASSLSRIGISVASDGTMKLDGDKLTAALKENPGSTTDALKSLATKAQDKVAQANYQRDRLFPSVNAMMGSDLRESKALYQATSGAAATKYSVANNLLSLMF